MEPVLRRHFLAAVSAAGARPGLINVREQGAAGDGVRLDTKAIQQAIEACAAAGGGVVYFPPGKYLTGTLYLKSNITSYLERGALILGSKSLEDYPVTVAQYRSYTDNYTERSLIYAENLENVGLEGSGVIDGQGAAFKGEYKVRPYMIRMIGCRNVTVSGVTLKDSPMWVQHYLACDNVYLRGITVASRVNANNDGIDIDSCARVRIADCDISSGDDAIVLKSTSARVCRNVTVTNCVLSTACNALKLGTESNGGFEDIVISNCVVYDTRLAGVALEIVDGGVMDRVTVSGITMNKVGAPVFVRLGNRARPFQERMAKPGVGRLRNVTLSGVQAAGAGKTGCSITGLRGSLVEHVTIENVRLWFEGGGTREDARRTVPEFPDKYPVFSMFGVLPAYGFYCRHARKLTFHNVEVYAPKDEERLPLVTDDVEDVTVSGSSNLGGA
jgi:polygalacturonase